MSPQDKRECNWSEEEEGENTRLLVTMQNLIMKVSDSELAMACCNWAIKTLPVGKEAFIVFHHKNQTKQCMYSLAVHLFK